MVFACNSKQKNKNSDNTNINFKKLNTAVLSAGNLYRVDSFPSKYIIPRPVDIWLPSDYSESKKYAVLYMHDGQMLFDATTTWNKQEWKVDEWVSQLTENSSIKDVIVVGIHNIPDIRWYDLFPEKAFHYLSQKDQDSIIKNYNVTDIEKTLHGDEYLKFLVEELKPIIDSYYTTLSDQKNTFVSGSSMGGLMSMYAISEYPKIFSSAACLSTHWVGALTLENNPFPDAIFKYMENHLPEPKTHRLYFDYGNKTLDQHYPQYAGRVDSILSTKGYDDSNSANLFFENTDHSENSWNKRLNVPLTFLLPTDEE